MKSRDTVSSGHDVNGLVHGLDCLVNCKLCFASDFFKGNF